MNKFFTNKIVCSLAVLLLVTVIACSGKSGSSSAGGSSAKGAASDAPKREDNGQYRIGPKVQVYDGDFKEIDAYFTYLPSNPWENQLTFDNAVVLNSPDLNWLIPYNEAFLLSRSSEKGSDDNIGFFRNSIDKSIEWADTAKKNQVKSLTKEIPTPDGDEDDTFTETVQLVGNPHTSINRVFIMFTFFIGDINKNGKEETLLIMQIFNTRTMSISRLFCFKENDFALLKEIFSESYLAKIDEQEATWQKSHAEQGELFK